MTVLIKSVSFAVDDSKDKHFGSARSQHSTRGHQVTAFSKQHLAKLEKKCFVSSLLPQKLVLQYLPYN